MDKCTGTGDRGTPTKRERRQEHRGVEKQGKKRRQQRETTQQECRALPLLAWTARGRGTAEAAAGPGRVRGRSRRLGRHRTAPLGSSGLATTQCGRTAPGPTTLGQRRIPAPEDVQAGPSFAHEPEPPTQSAQEVRGSRQTSKTRAGRQQGIVRATGQQREAQRSDAGRRGHTGRDEQAGEVDGRCGLSRPSPGGRSITHTAYSDSSRRGPDTEATDTDTGATGERKRRKEKGRKEGKESAVGWGKSCRGSGGNPGPGQPAAGARGSGYRRAPGGESRAEGFSSSRLANGTAAARRGQVARARQRTSCGIGRRSLPHAQGEEKKERKRTGWEALLGGERRDCRTWLLTRPWAQRHGQPWHHHAPRTTTASPALSPPDPPVAEAASGGSVGQGRG